MIIMTNNSLVAFEEKNKSLKKMLKMVASSLETANIIILENNGDQEDFNNIAKLIKQARLLSAE